MADILIKGMELPKDKLEYLHLIIQDGKVHTAISCGHLTTDKLNVATAIELPSHGRLKDLDVMQKEIAEKVCEDCHAYCGDVCDVYRCLSVIYNSPTIVEANNE